jgi:hypothetical protein
MLSELPPKPPVLWVSSGHREVSPHFAVVHGASASKYTISRITDRVSDEVEGGTAARCSLATCSLNMVTSGSGRRRPTRHRLRRRSGDLAAVTLELAG